MTYRTDVFGIGDVVKWDDSEDRSDLIAWHGEGPFVVCGIKEAPVCDWELVGHSQWVFLNSTRSGGLSGAHFVKTASI